VIRFNFSLLPVGEIQPWTNGDGTDPRLHWFALSDGHYWITIGDVDLFCTSETKLSELREEGWAVSSPYVDYQVVRLWEDVLDCLPEFLEPVPDDLHGFIRSKLSEWDETDSNSADSARSWWANHFLSSGHVMTQPVRWWRDTSNGTDVVWTEWLPSDQQEWFAAPPEGRVATPTAEFIAAIEDFDARFIAGMAVQIETAANGGVDPSIRLDIEQLFSEHPKRAEHLSKSRKRFLATDWAEIRQGASEIQIAQ
jgi:hypothetical protein